MTVTGSEVRDIGKMMIKHLPADLLQESGDVLTVCRACVAIDLANLAMSFDRRYMLCAFKHFITDLTSQLAGAGIRVSIFKRCNDATVRLGRSRWCMRHATSLLYHVHAIASHSI